MATWWKKRGGNSRVSGPWQSRDLFREQYVCAAEVGCGAKLAVRQSQDESIAPGRERRRERTRGPRLSKNGAKKVANVDEAFPKPVRRIRVGFGLDECGAGLGRTSLPPWPS